MTQDIPIWNLTSLYGGFQDTRWLSDKEEFLRLSGELTANLLQPWPLDLEGRASWLETVLKKTNRLDDILETLESFSYMLYSANTSDTQALKEINLLERDALPAQRAGVRLRKILADPDFGMESLFEVSSELREQAYFLREMKLWAEKEMGEEMEDLAADLGRAGGDAWGRLQESISSQLSVVWDNDTGDKKTVVELRQMASDPDRAVRKRAWQLETEAWRSVELPLAAALNGVKGFSVILNKRRGWETTLEKSARQSRLSVKALEALLSSIRSRLPVFQRYLGLKARALGIPVCSFYDLFAPVGISEKLWSWNEARLFIENQFAFFSPELRDYAALAFDGGWIHARSQQGKIGGAYCTSLPLQKESRILSNFDGTFGEIKTLAHELGHGYHFHVLREDPPWKRGYPMTLAETASTFAETIVFEAAFRQAEGPEALFLIENQLQDITQVCVDILSRFEFESALMVRRLDNELSPTELSEMMLEAQKGAYGLGLNPGELHPWMWAVKGHYYSPELAFYNFPYAFGQLLSLSLFQRFKVQGPSFAREYVSLLKKTGSSDCTETVRAIGEDIETEDFWLKGLDEVQRLTQEMEGLIP